MTPDNHACAAALLRIEGVSTGYSDRVIVDNVSITVSSGEIVALVGHNGSGKSTLLRAIFGIIPIWTGRLFFDSQLVIRPNPIHWRASGVIYVPQGSRVFADFSVHDNLRMACLGGVNDRVKEREGVDRVLQMFPNLAPKLRHSAGSLAGGERQMLSLATALMKPPRLLLLDEPSSGFDEPTTEAVFTALRALADSERVSILVVEQRVRRVVSLSDRVYVLRNGRVAFSGDSKELSDETALARIYI